jgi:uncharacterized membrane protein
MTITTQLLAVCGVMAVMAIPLIVGIVPPNRMYGFRTPATLRDRALWYRTNRFAGAAFLLASLVSAALLLLFTPAIMPLLALVAPVLGAVVACLIYLRRIQTGRR